MTSYLRLFDRPLGIRRLYAPALTVLMCSSSMGLWAADAPAVQTGNFEIGGFAGTSYGLDNVRFMGGGNVAYALTRNIMPYGEFSYFPGISHNGTVGKLSDGSTGDYTFSTPLADFHGGVHIRLLTHDRRFVPYLAVGAGVIHAFKSDYEVIFKNTSGATIFDQKYTAPSASGFAANFGGGVRFYVSDRWGFRVEAKVYKPTGNYTDVFTKAEAGVFYQIK